MKNQFTSLLGHVSRLRILEIGEPHALLDPQPGRRRGEADPPFLRIPSSELPEDASVEKLIDAFVYLDSNDLPIATTATPHLMAGEVAFLEVVDSTPFGVFVDWGLPKDLLVPYKEQAQAMEIGKKYPVALYIDESGRLAGSNRVSDLLVAGGDFEAGEWVDGVFWRSEPEIGTFVILERRFLALLPPTEPCTMEAGQAGRFRISLIRPDGKIEVSLRAVAHRALEGDATSLRALLARPDAPCLGDRSSPEEIREYLGISKKAFKRAAGRLLKLGEAAVDQDGYLRLVDPSKRRSTRNTERNGRNRKPRRAQQGKESASRSGSSQRKDAGKDGNRQTEGQPDQRKYRREYIPSSK